MISFEALAQEAYEAYRESVLCADSAGRIWGQPCCTWAQLEADRQAAWVEAVKRVTQRVSELH